ncbi:hypothetical protein E2C01_015280 [Portunus trituberculatus]|uniref:Uncharacterized protein n=1 Tax=Portunus trituberculatus TaxID=210409 RepID=A0A5B7DME8_PORTR|nr:hypothetical protein [Portunus trituberculatus]
MDSGYHRITDVTTTTTTPSPPLPHYSITPKASRNIPLHKRVNFRSPVRNYSRFFLPYSCRLGNKVEVSLPPRTFITGAARVRWGGGRGTSNRAEF